MRVGAKAPRGSGWLGRLRLPRQPPPTFQPAANLAVCFIGGLERRIQPERYATFWLEFVGKLIKLYILSSII